MTASSSFLVFRSNPEAQNKDDALIRYPATNAHVQWPSDVRKGRPRKDRGDPRRASEQPPKETRFSRHHYGFVDCTNGRQPTDANVRTFIRTHVMHHRGWQKRGLQDVMIANSHNDAKEAEREARQCLSPERWSRDPFNSFPMTMQPHMHELLYTYVSAAADRLYPIETTWGFNPTAKFWVPLALTDPLLLNSILFTSEHFEAMMRGQAEHPSAINHLTRTIQILNERLQRPLQEISDSTVAAIAGLALTEQSSGNQANWRIHMRGIKRMVEMRGGLSTFEHDLVLYDKLCRADICGSIYSLSKPSLQMQNRGIQPSLLPTGNEMERKLAPGFQALHDHAGLDNGLLDVLCEVDAITRDMNIVNPPKSEIIPLRLRGRMRAIQYYLLRENYTIDGPRDRIREACCLGVLLYVGIIQNEFDVSPISKRFLQRLKSCLQSQSFVTDSTRALRLWVIFLAGSLLRDPVERSWSLHAIVEMLSQSSLRNWSDIKLLLETFAWSGKVQDRSGEDLWDEAARMGYVLQQP